MPNDKKNLLNTNNQQVNHSIDQAIDQGFNQALNRPLDQPPKRAFDQPPKRPLDRPPQAAPSPYSPQVGPQGTQVPQVGQQSGPHNPRSPHSPYSPQVGPQSPQVTQVNILTEPYVAPSIAKPWQMMKICPKCNTIASADMALCPHCKKLLYQEEFDNKNEFTGDPDAVHISQIDRYAEKSRKEEFDEYLKEKGKSLRKKYFSEHYVKFSIFLVSLIIISLFIFAEMKMNIAGNLNGIYRQQNPQFYDYLEPLVVSLYGENAAAAANAAKSRDINLDDFRFNALRDEQLRKDRFEGGNFIAAAMLFLGAAGPYFPFSYRALAFWALTWWFIKYADYYKPKIYTTGIKSYEGLLYHEELKRGYLNKLHKKLVLALAALELIMLPMRIYLMPQVTQTLKIKELGLTTADMAMGKARIFYLISTLLFFLLLGCSRIIIIVYLSFKNSKQKELPELDIKTRKERPYYNENYEIYKL